MVAHSSSLSRVHKAALRLFAERGSTVITVSELAEAARVARGTIYNNGLSPDTLFEDIASQLSEEMNSRIIKSLAHEEDPAIRLANGIRMYIRRAHEEPDWGKFICKFAFSNKAMLGLWTGQDSPVPDVLQGLDFQRYNFRKEQLIAVMAMIAGGVLTSIFMVLEGHKTWREIGSEMAELVLIALGVDNKEAYDLDRQELPTLLEA
ncbi:MAG: TetR/AcrR family transcriptional regulator [Pseudomonadota bacterium]|jgi:AcrR family transcriptional regulator|nr:TetR/AcrR family transcriptional regulator [Pseudomonadota bacterium]